MKNTVLNTQGIATLAAGARQLASSFIADQRGTNAIEFAVVSPFLIAAWLGFYSLVETQDVSTRVGKVSAAIADIVSQSPAVTPQQIDAAMDAALAIMGTQNPNLNGRANELEMEVVGVEVDNNQNAIVKWSRGRHVGSLPANGSSYPLPAELKLVEGFIVAARVSYSFHPPFGSQMVDNVQMEYKNYFIPRISSTTECTSC